MKLDNLSKHGILTANFNEYEQNPPPSLDVPIAVIVISLIMIIITGLMILGIIKQRLLFIAPWLIIFSFGIIGEIIFFVHQLISYFSLELLLYILCIIGIQILILSPVAFLFHDLRCKNREKHFFETNLKQEVQTINSDPSAPKIYD
ncbi:hypothetical protein FF38_09699 [Lucilia cuprina]|uniref:Uncharacterized protein n=1 Tax=Lucilia cuprina TaxID=7375 RepID=A0A0L0C7J7_LUCCU|nr:hypothetical protein FF38_09699 [Lucilia cuprina]